MPPSPEHTLSAIVARAPGAAAPGRPRRLALSWQFLRRDWRAGELGLLLAALVVAAAAVASVGFFVDRMRQALSLEARQLLGADLVIVADRAPEPAWLADATQRGLATAQTVIFPSMVSASGRPWRMSRTTAAGPIGGYPARFAQHGRPDRGPIAFR